MSDVIFHDWNEGFKLQFFSGSADVKLECYTTVCLFGDYIIIIDVNCKLIYISQGIFLVNVLLMTLSHSCVLNDSIDTNNVIISVIVSMIASHIYI